METYIINPMWFYWINVASAVKTASITLLGVTATVFLIWVAIYSMECSPFDEEEGAFFAKYAKLSFAVIGVFTLLSIFVPSQKTLISMMVAKFATYDNAQWTADAIKSTVDYIIEAFKTIG